MPQNKSLAPAFVLRAFRWFMQRQTEIFLTLTLAVVLGNTLCVPAYTVSAVDTYAPSHHLEHWINKFMYLSYEDATRPGLYHKGRDDIWIVAFFIGVFWFARDACMALVFGPLARLCGIRTARAVVRFCEQMWYVVYCPLSFGAGVYVMQHSPARNFNVELMFRGYPHTPMPAVQKWYYLVELAFWLQQIVVLNLEKRRKDFWEMFLHHIFTNVLMVFSYAFNYTLVGSAILTIMDVCDFLLSSAKVILYLGMPNAADVFFGLFLVGWIITRHILFGRIIYAIIFELPDWVPPRWDPRAGYYMTPGTQTFFITFLCALQVIIFFWSVMIFRVAYRTIVGLGATDTRSEDGSDDAGERKDK